jgi:peptide/nickel transport system permease protein
VTGSERSTALLRTPQRVLLLTLLGVMGRSIGRVLLVVWGATTAGFIALRLVPGDPVDVMLGVQAQVSESLREQIRMELGLNQPPLRQYFQYLWRLSQGDMGVSYQLRSPVREVISQNVVPTLELTAAALTLALLLAMVGALIGREKRMKRIISLLELVVISSPTFWIGLVFLAVFSFHLKWFPVTSTDGFASLVLPAITLALPVAGIASQVLRQGLDFASGQPFSTTARSRGISPAGLVLRHTLRHAAMDTLTISGYLAGSLLGGAVLVETVFARPGLGQVAIRAIIGRDIPVVLGVIVVAALVFALLNLVVDLSYRFLDPRLRGLNARWRA